MQRFVPGSVLTIVMMVMSLAIALPIQAAAQESNELDGQVTEHVDLSTDDDENADAGASEDEATGETPDDTGDQPGDDTEDTGDDFETTPIDVDLGVVAPGETSGVYDASRGVFGGTLPYTFSVSVQGERGTASVDAASGALTYTANVDAAPGADGIQLRVCDSTAPTPSCGELYFHILIAGEDDFETTPVDIDLGEVAPGETSATYDAHNGVSGGTPPYTFSVGIYPLYGTVSVDATTGLVAYTASDEAAPGFDDFSVGVCDSAATPACDQIFFHVQITDGSGGDTPTPTETATPEPTEPATPDQEPTKPDTQHDKKDTDTDEAVTTLPATGYGPGSSAAPAVLLGIALLLTAMAALSMRLGRGTANG